MLAGCPSCKTRYTLDESKMPAGGVKLRCSKCRTVFIVRKKSAPEQQPQAKAAAPEKAYKVIIANSDPAICETVETVLRDENIDVIKSQNGIEAMSIIEQKRPHVAILDVALPGMYGFEVCERIKNSPVLKEIKVILMASIYDKTKYKRLPAQLYGADDYIEKHHIHDDLITKINRLLLATKPEPPSIAQEPAAGGGEEAVTQEIPNVVATDKELEKLQEMEKEIPKGDSEVIGKAKRLARLIVSDIALYNGNGVLEGIRNGNIRELLKEDIREGLGHLKSKVPPTISAETYIDEALEEFIAKRKKEMGIS